MNTSSSIAALAEALAKAQGEMEGAKRDSKNPFFNSKYADLSSVWEAIRQPLSRNGIAVLQMPRYADGLVSVETMVLHSSGEWMSETFSGRPVKEDPQSLGSLVTYLKRYSLTGLGVAPEDDDGNAASGKSSKPVETLDKPVTFTKPSMPASLPPLDELVAAAAQAQDGPIDRGRQVNFNKSFREALPQDHKAAAETIRHEWLAANKYLDGDGNPSCTVITTSQFEDVKSAAIAFAKEYGK